MKSIKISKVLYIGSIVTVASVLLATFTMPLLQKIKVDAHAPQLTIQKAGNKSVIKPGDTLKFTITVTNHGDPDFVAGHNDMTAYDVVVTDNLPSGFTRTSDGASTLTWTIGKLNAGQTWQKTFQAKTSTTISAGGYLNVAKVTAKHKVNGAWVNYPTQRATFAVKVEANTPPPTTTTTKPPTTTRPPTTTHPPTTTKPPVVQNPLLSIDKITSTNVVNKGGIANYFVSITNSGSGTATNVSLTDTMPGGFTHTTNSQSIRTWDLSNIVPGETKNITYSANVANNIASGSYINTAVATASNHSSVSDTALVMVQNPPVVTNPVLSLNKVANTASVNAGGTATYTITVSNSGNAMALNVMLFDDLPNGFTYTTTGQNTRSWALGNLSLGETKTISYTASVASNVANGFYTNTATVTSNNYASLTDTAVVQVRGQILGDEFDPTLVIEKTANRKSVNPGGTITYTITVKNFGEADAINLTLTDVLPQGFSEIDTGNTSLVWTQNILEKNGGVWQITYRARVSNTTQEGDYLNTAIVSAENHSKQVKAEYLVQVRKGEVLGDTGVTLLQIIMWFVSAGTLAFATYQIRRKFVLVKNASRV